MVCDKSYRVNWPLRLLQINQEERAPGSINRNEFHSQEILVQSAPPARTIEQRLGVRFLACTANELFANLSLR